MRGADQQAQSRAPVRPRRILLAEDDDDIRGLLGQLLESSVESVEVIEARSGTEALRLAEERPVDLLVTDYKMPGMNGIDLVLLLRQSSPQVPAVLMTAYADMEVALRAINEAHVQSFLSKPVDPQQVVRVVSGILQAWQPAAAGVRDVTPRGEPSPSRPEP